MRTARHGASGQVFNDPEAFGRLPNREELRRDLSCTECAGSGHFRGASRTGQPALFAAKHTPNCSQRSTDPDLVRAVDQVSVQMREAISSREEFTLQPMEFTRETHTVEAEEEADGSKLRLGRKYDLADSPGKARAKHNLRVVLRDLVHNPASRTLHTKVFIDSAYTPLNELSVLVNQPLESRPTDQRLFWGRIYSVGGKPPGFRWINFGPAWETNMLSIQLDRKSVDKLLMRDHLEDDLAKIKDYWIIALGRLDPTSLCVDMSGKTPWIALYRGEGAR